ncbi:FAD-dependent oxidoreductase family protein [Heracleum sosnowskyi]|uniref:FAD-dependent oxidoreductase family protein n=1 Tax=Heracleum sosnowskyi TaxID=360622 RepID=A0AAD8M8T8_9APIA|nr:FAD-dependent oxidoreductase family protein [Heracleum sosnowskyi]
MSVISSAHFSVPPNPFVSIKKTTKAAIRIQASSSMDNNPQSTNSPPKKVVVCGGGVIGVCAAYYLSKKGAAVTLIEKSSIACAASGKAGGFLALDWCDDGPLGSLARASFNLHRSLAQELDGVPEWVNGAAKQVRTIGTHETTAQVHPQLFTRTLLSKAVAEHGVEVVIGKLERVVAEAGCVTAVELEGGRVVEADAVVLALGPWTSKLSMLNELFRVYGLKAHSIVLEPKEADAITPHALFLSYYAAGGGKPMDPEVYPRPTGEVYICGMSAEAEVPDDPEEVLPNPESIEVLKKVAKNVSSHLGEGEASVKAEQACFLPCTDDSAPVIGEIPGVKGCYVATGHNCWGILNGPATGAAVAELVLDGHATIVNLQKFSPARFVGRRKS